MCFHLVMSKIVFSSWKNSSECSFSFFKWTVVRNIALSSELSSQTVQFQSALIKSVLLFLTKWIPFILTTKLLKLLDRAVKLTQQESMIRCNDVKNIKYLALVDRYSGYYFRKKLRKGFCCWDLTLEPSLTFTGHSILPNLVYWDLIIDF